MTTPPIPPPIRLEVTIDRESAERIAALCEAEGCVIGELVRKAMAEEAESAARGNVEPQIGEDG